MPAFAMLVSFFFLQAGFILYKTLCGLRLNEEDSRFVLDGVQLISGVSQRGVDHTSHYAG